MLRIPSLCEAVRERQTQSRKGTLMDDLTGTSDQRARRLAILESQGELPPDWVRRQLDLALSAWSVDEKKLDVDAEGREDF
jgi:hypothetical protein